MPTLWDEKTRAEIIGRVKKLDTGSAPRFGKMQVCQMLAHASDVQRMVLGSVETHEVPGVYRVRPIAYALIHWLPWPKGKVDAPPDALRSKPEEFETARDKLVELMQQFGSKSPTDSWPDHPIFGKLTPRDWGVFGYRHLDHHLDQFGV